MHAIKIPHAADMGMEISNINLHCSGVPAANFLYSHGANRALITENIRGEKKRKTQKKKYLTNMSPIALSSIAKSKSITINNI